MSTAQQVLVAYGVLIIGYGFILGIPLARERAVAAEASAHLVGRHVASIMQGPVCLGLAYAFGVTGFESGLATAAAVLVVAGAAVETVGGTVNWLTRTGDQFAERSLGYRFSAASGPVAVIGIVVATAGVLVGM
ncbi:MAG: hypothetical protein M5U14_22175 [Acidimicrobiia bacterium]|nr:hypothetical protein [Acidimicrobiia bacterium]